MPFSPCACFTALQTWLMTRITRRNFLKGAAGGAAALSYASPAFSAEHANIEAIKAEIHKRHDEAVRRLQQWIHQPSIAAENRGVSEGCELTMQMLREAGFQKVTRAPTDGHPGTFASLHADAQRTVGLY